MKTNKANKETAEQLELPTAPAKKVKPVAPEADGTDIRKAQKEIKQTKAERLLGIVTPPPKASAPLPVPDLTGEALFTAPNESAYVANQWLYGAAGVAGKLSTPGNVVRLGVGMPLEHQMQKIFAVLTTKSQFSTLAPLQGSQIETDDGCYWFRPAPDETVLDLYKRIHALMRTQWIDADCRVFIMTETDSIETIEEALPDYDSFYDDDAECTYLEPAPGEITALLEEVVKLSKGRRAALSGPFLIHFEVFASTESGPLDVVKPVAPSGTVKASTLTHLPNERTNETKPVIDELAADHFTVIGTYVDEHDGRKADKLADELATEAAKFLIDPDDYDTYEELGAELDDLRPATRAKPQAETAPLSVKPPAPPRSVLPSPARPAPRPAAKQPPAPPEARQHPAKPHNRSVQSATPPAKPAKPAKKTRTR